jgi:anti-anti-sigma factor
MALIGSSCTTVSDRPALSREGPEAGPIVVWLWGEHDLSTDDALCAVLARAMALDRAGLVLDLSEVEFMAASTLGVIVRARDFLRQRSRSLTVRCPSGFVGRVISACGLNDLLTPSPEITGDEKGKALGTRVAAPAAPLGDGQTSSSRRVPEPVRARVSRTIELRARVLSAEGLAESG